jgi:folate-binding protein YgfZ
VTSDAATAGLHFATRARDAVRATGPDAEAHLNRLLSNDVAAVPVRGSQDALLLTPKARVIAPVRLLRRTADDFLLLTEPGLGPELTRQLLRSRFAAKVDIAAEEHAVTLVVGEGWEPPAGVLAADASADVGAPAWEIVDADPPAAAAPLAADELERLRIRARSPRFGAEIDDRVMPAEAGLVERAISFTKGCYPGQEPVARLHYRGHANRGLRTLLLAAGAGATGAAGAAATLPPYDAPVVHEGKEVGRVTSAIPAAPGEVLALAYVRVEVPADAVLDVDGVAARQLG